MKDIDAKLVLKACSDIFVLMGVYPKSIVDGKGVKTDRTEWQEGWNAAFKDMSKQFEAVEKLLSTDLISDEVALLMIADVGWLENQKIILNMNDTFWYGADAEEITLDEAKEVARLFAIYGYKGITYWVANKRKYYPEIAKHKADVEEVRMKERGTQL